MEKSQEKLQDKPPEKPLDISPQQKLVRDISRFLAIYKVLSSEARAAFEAQMESTLKSVDAPTRRLYVALLDSAKDNCDFEETVDNMNRAAQGKAYK
jgi:hypothetical protein